VLEDEESHEIDGQTDRAYHEDKRGVADGFRPRQALQRFHQDGEIEGGQEDGVAEGAHHLGPSAAVRGAGTPSALVRQASCDEAHAESEHVGEHAEGVGDQRDGVAHVARHQFGHEEARCHD
uniref:Uncharacterized protein n=1 Tax=Pseudonaja textilis TaxID=8673 RepID=A0A670ZCR8_PSETE